MIAVSPRASVSCTARKYTSVSPLPVTPCNNCTPNSPNSERARMPFSALSCSGFNSCAGGVYPASNASSAGSIGSSQLSSSLSRNIRSITERVTCASFSSCGNGSGPRSVSSNSRTRCSFSPGDSEAVEGFQATMRCVLRFRPTTSSRNSIKPRRWSLRRTLPSTPGRSEERSIRGDFLRERSPSN